MSAYRDHIIITAPNAHGRTVAPDSIDDVQRSTVRR